VEGLDPREFVLLDNGKLQRFDAEGFIPPIALITVVQTGANTGAALMKIAKIGSMIGPLISGERGSAAVITFDSEVRVRQSFTRDTASVSNAIAALIPRSGGARMLDALSAAIMMFRDGPRDHRRVVLLIGEAKDRGSENRIESIATALQRDNVMVFSITYSPFLSAFTAKQLDVPKAPGGANVNLLGVFEELGRLGKENTSALLVHHSGGRRIGFLSQGALEKAVAEIGEELHSQYLLGFSPEPAAAAGYHKIEVRVPRLPGAIVRFRPGYWLAAP
jgi:VWFA-related protein